MLPPTNSEEIQGMKFWRHTIAEQTSIKNPIKRLRNTSNRYINHQLQCIAKVTSKVILDFPKLKALPTFEQNVVQLTLGDNVYEQELKKLQTVYAACHSVGNSYQAKSKAIQNVQDLENLEIELVQELQDSIESSSQNLQSVVDMTKVLRSLPVIDLTLPIVAFAGAPNVGKSSLVHAFSTASPEIANYPFTTRGLTIGHIAINEVHYQIADTPGLLNRVKRNRIEKLALTMLLDTKAIVAFVMDASESCGMRLGDQLEIRSTLKELLPNRPWIDVVSKCDLLSSGAQQEVKSLLPVESIYSVSTTESIGLAELKSNLVNVLLEVKK